MLQLQTTTLRTSWWLCVHSISSRRREWDFFINTAALWSPSPLWYQLDCCSACISNSLHFFFFERHAWIISLPEPLFSFVKSELWHVSKIWLIQMRELYELRGDKISDAPKFPSWSPLPSLTAKSFISLWCNKEASCLFLLTNEKVAVLNVPK